MQSEMVSVIMPAYNAADCIRASVESVLRQSYRNLELLVIDDGSQDATADVLGGILSEDSRVRLIRQENQGVSGARNTGLEQAKGTWIAFLDADDFWKEDFLEQVYHAAEKSRSDFVYARTMEKFMDGREAVVGPQPSVAGTLENFLHFTGELRLTFHISAVLIRRQIIDDYGIRFPVGIKQSEDTAFFIELLSIIPASPVEQVLTQYCAREEAATRQTWFPRDWEGQVVIYEQIEPFVRENAPKHLPVFYRMRNYVAYRFILRCLKAGFMKEARIYIGKWNRYLWEFAHGNGKLNDRMKCRLILKNKRMLLTLAGKL